jgi:WD40 repeat protein
MTMTKPGLALAMLLAVAAAAPACGDLKSQARISLDSVSYTPDGTLVAFTSGGIFLFDDPTLQAIKGRIALEGLTTLETPAQYQYSLSQDGTVAAAVYSPASNADARAALYRVPTGETLSTFGVASTSGQEIPNRLDSIALSPHGEELAVGQPLGSSGLPFEVYDTASGVGLWTESGYKVWPVAFDDAELFTLDVLNETTPSGAVLEGSDWRLGPQWSQPLSVAVQALATVGNTAVGEATSPANCTGQCQVDFMFWRFIDGQLAAQVAGPPNAGPAWGFLGRPVFTCSATDDVCAAQLTPLVDKPSGTWTHIFRKDGTVVATLPFDSDWVGSIALSPDGQYLAVAILHYSYADDVVAVYRIADGALVGSHGFAAADLL